MLEGIVKAEKICMRWGRLFRNETGEACMRGILKAT